MFNSHLGNTLLGFLRKKLSSIDFVSILLVGCFSPDHPVYPGELELEKENAGFTDAIFLDLGIEIINKKFAYILYDKRDEFGFPIVKMPYLSNNIHFISFIYSIQLIVH